MKQIAWALLLAASTVMLGQQTGGGGGVPGAGGSATLPTATAAGQDLRATGAGTTYVAKNATAQVELSCASDIGAQFNTAVTALSSVGRIILPNCTNIPMSTTANVPPGISIQGYGKLASIINCTVAGDCFKLTMNPTTVGEISGEYSGFGINGSGASNQVLWHGSGQSGSSMHDIQFEPYPGSGNAADCLKLTNDVTGQFTEGNSIDVSLERQCTNGMLFSQNVAGDAQNSFGYNFFRLHVVSQGSNYAVTLTATASGVGTAFLYNGQIQIFGNHVGPGGGILQFLNGFSTDAALGQPNERIYIAVEENGTGAGTVVNIPGTGSLIRAYGNVVNGAFNGSGTSLATTYNDPNNSFFLYSDVATDKSGNYTMPNQLTVGSIANSGGVNLVPSGVSTPIWQMAVSSGANQMYFINNGGTGSVTGFPLVLYNAPFAGANALRGLTTTSDGGYQFVSTTTGATVDTSITRPAAGVVGIGTPTSLTGGSTQAAAYTHTGTTFSVTGCGTATGLSGGSTGGQFTGGSATCSPVITMGGFTAPHGFFCGIQDQTTGTAVFRQTANTTTTCTLTGSGTIGATDVLVFHAEPF